MTAKLRIAARLKAKLRAEVRVYGLRAPAELRFDGASVEATPGDPGDEGIVAGFAAAERAMWPLDLERRLWSGRLAELFGTQPLGGVPADDLDIFLRLLGLRADAGRRVRAMEPAHRDALGALAAGLNAWTDAGRWQAEPVWASHATRPRLWAPVDLELLATARRDAATLTTEVPATPHGWPVGWTGALRRRLDAVRSAAAGPGRGCDALDSWLGRVAGPTPAAAPAVPALAAESVLPGGDDHRVGHGDGWVRMSVRRPDVAVRGESPRRPWLRQTPRGPLVSDVLAGAESASPPTGPGFSFAWAGPSVPLPPRAPAPPRDGRVRLVPLTEGA